MTRTGFFGFARSLSGRVWAASVFVALFFSLSFAVGRRVNASEDLGLTSRSGMVMFVLEVGVSFLLNTLALVAAYSWLQHRDAPTLRAAWAAHQGDNEADSTTLSPDMAAKALPIRSAATFRTWGLISAAWLPYWLLLWPGVITVDSTNQIRQVMGLLPFNDHHPLEMTLAIGAILLPLRALTGSVNFSLSVITLLQLVALAAIYALTSAYIRRVTSSTRVWKAAVALFALHPMVAVYSVSVLKDAWISALLALLAAFLTDMLARIRRQQIPSRGDWVCLGLLVVAIGMAKKTGIYVVLPTAVVTVLVLMSWRRHFAQTGQDAISQASSRERGRRGVVPPPPEANKQLRRSPLLAAGAFAAGTALYLVSHSGLLALTHTETSSPAEALSIPVQQIARVVRDHGDELSWQTRSEIEFFFPGTDLAAKYLPGLSDPVKGSLDRQRFSDNKGRFVSLWLSVVRQYPATTTKATLVGTRGYWYPEARHWLIYVSDWDAQVGGFLKNVAKLEPSSLDPNFQEGDEVLGWPKVILDDLLHDVMRNIPGVNLFFSLGYWTWTAVFLTGGLWVRRRSVGLPAVSVVVLSWGICMISPVFAEARYALPILVTLPVLLGALTSAPLPACNFDVGGRAYR